MKLTTQLTREANEKLTELLQRLAELEQRHELYAAQDAESQRLNEMERKLDDELNNAVIAINEKYWEPSYSADGSGYPRKDLVQAFTKKGFSRSAIQAACDELREEELEQLEQQSWYQQKREQSKMLSRQAYEAISSEHYKLHSELGDVERSIHFWKARLKNISDASWVRSYGKVLAENARKDAEREALRVEAEKVKALLKNGYGARA